MLRVTQNNLIGGSKGGTGGGPVWDPPVKSQVAICCLTNTGMDPSYEAIGPKGVQLFLEGGLYGPL